MARQGLSQRAAAIGDAPNRPKYYRCSPRLGRVSQIFRLLASEDWPVTRVGVISDEFWAVVEDKYALTYLGGVLLACAVIHARVGTPKLGDTP